MARLLLIEDDADIRALLERFLKRSGFAVTAVGDGEVGIKTFTEHAFDIVVTDGLLPRKSGYDVIRAVRAMPKGHDVGVVMITAAFKGPKARKDAFDQGVDAFFAKPFILGDLKDKLVEILLKHGKALETTPAPRPAPHPAPAATSDLSPPPKSDPAARRAPSLPHEIAVAAPKEVAQALLACARQRLTGTVVLVDESSHLKLAFLRGVVVGASDNLREHLLGERLWKQGRLTTEQMRMLNARMAKEGERVAEALLALGLCSADEALGFVDEQAATRVRRALMWTGRLRVIDDEQEAHRMAVSGLQLIDVILSFGFEPGQLEDADIFVAAHKAERLDKAPDFDDLLLAFARVRPDATLPTVVLAGTPTVAEAAKSSSSQEVFAAHLAGLVRLASDGAPDPRPLPEMMRNELAAELVDRELVNRICGMLLKGRGRSYYDLLDLPCDVASDVTKARLDELAREIGPGAVMGKALGPATPAARELWTLLDDAYQTFADPDRRAAYDALLAYQMPAQGHEQRARDEDAFLEGQQALAAADPDKARACFARAVESRPGDAEFESYLGWAEVLTGDANGVARLMNVMREHPQSMRPLFFLGLVAAKDGDAARARSLLQECVRRAPLDIEVAAALTSLD